MEDPKPQSFTKLDEIKLDLNIDRIIPYGDNFVTTSYHLNKETGLKSGDINIIQIQDQKIKTVGRSQVLDYGILSIKHEKDNQFTLGASDGNVKLVGLDEQSKELTLLHEYKPTIED